MSRCIRVAEGIERSGRFELTRLWELCVPNFTGEAEQVAQFIQQAVLSLDLRATRTTVVFSGDTVQAKNIELGPMRPGERREAIRLALQSHFPDTARVEQITDHVPIATRSGQDRFLGVSACEETVTSYIDALAQARVSRSNCIGDFAALERLIAAQPDVQEDRPVAVLHLGTESCEISTYYHGRFEARHVIKLGYNDLVAKLREPVPLGGGRTFQLGEYEAQSFLEQYPLDQSAMVPGPDGEEIPSDRIHALVRPVLELVIRDVTKWIRLYQVETLLPWPRKMLLCGDGERIGGLSEFLVKYLGISVETLDPTLSIDVADAVAEQYSNERLASYALVIGAAMDRGDRVRLYPRERAVRARVRTFRRMVRYTAAAVVAWMISFVLAHRSTEADAPERVRAAREHLAAVQTPLAIFEVAERLERERALLLARLQQLEPRDARVAPILRDMARALSAGITIDRLELDMSGTGGEIEARGVIRASERQEARQRIEALSARLDHSPQFAEPSISVKSWDDPVRPAELEISSQLVFPPVDLDFETQEEAR